MSEAYGVYIKVAIDDTSLTGQMTDLIRNLERAQAATDSLNTSIKGLSENLNGAVARASALADSMERAARASSNMGRGGGGGNNGGNGGSEGNEPSRSSHLPTQELLQMSGSGGGGGEPPSGTRSLLGGPEDPRRDASFFDTRTPHPLAEAALQNGRRPNRSSHGGDWMMDGIAADLGYDFFRDNFEASAEAGNVIEKMRASRITQAQIDKSKQLAISLMTSVPGSGYAHNLDLINQTTAFTGNFDEAFALTPTLAKDAQVLSLYGKGDAVKQIEMAVKAGELTGLTKQDGSMDIDRLKEFVTRLTQTSVASGGTLDMGKYLTGMRQFGIGSDAASMDFTTAILPAYMKIMGESRAGNALASLQQSLLSAKPNTQNKAYIREQQRLGIRDKNGHLSEESAHLLATDPNEFVVEKILKPLHDHGFNTPEQIRNEMSRLLPRQTMERLVGAGIFDEAVINKEANRNRAQQAAGEQPLTDLLANAPGNQGKQFQEAFKLFQTSLGDAFMPTAISALHGLTEGLNLISAFGRAHPDGMRAILNGVAAGLAVLGGAALVGGLIALAGPGGAIAGVVAGVAVMITSLHELANFLHIALPSLFGDGKETKNADGTTTRSGILFDKNGFRIRNHASSDNYNTDQHGALYNFFHAPINSYFRSRDSIAPVPQSQNQPIVLHGVINADGRALGEITAKGLVQGMRSSSSSGIGSFDNSMAPMPTGAGA